MRAHLAALLLATLPALAGAAPATMSPELASQLARIMENKDPDAVLAQLKSLAERWRRPGDLPFILRERAALLIQAQAYDEARDELQAALAGQPEDYGTSLRFLLGQIYLLEDNAEAAVSYLAQWAAHTESPSPAGLFMLGYAHLRLDQFEEAAVALEQTLAAAQGIRIRPRWVEVLAYVYTRLGRTDEAIGLLEGLVAEHPAEARWWRQLSTVYLLLDDVGRGAAGFTIAARLEALTLADARRLARLFGYLNMPADGAALLSKVLEADPPGGYEDRMLVAELLILAREFDAAVQTLESAAADAPDGEPWLMIGQLQLQREQYQQADAALARALVRYGEDAPALLSYLRAVTAINLGDLETADASIRAFENDPEMGSRVPALKTYLQSRRAAAR